MARLILEIDGDTHMALAQRAAAECRTVREQARYLLERKLDEDRARARIGQAIEQRIIERGSAHGRGAVPV